MSVVPVPAPRTAHGRLVAARYVYGAGAAKNSSISDPIPGHSTSEAKIGPHLASASASASGASCQAGFHAGFHSGDARRKPLLLPRLPESRTPEDEPDGDGVGRPRQGHAASGANDFNLTALITSVERDIWLLEQMERASDGDTGNVNNANAAHDDNDDILSLPGYRPRRRSTSETVSSGDRAGDPSPSQDNNHFYVNTHQAKGSRQEEHPNAETFSRGARAAQSIKSSSAPALPPKVKIGQQKRQQQQQQQQQEIASKLSAATSIASADYVSSSESDHVSVGGAAMAEQQPFSPDVARDLEVFHQRLLPRANCVTNILYSRRLPSPPVFRRDGHSARVSPDDADLRRIRAMQRTSPNSRRLFCPLCTQTFGHPFGLECHLTSFHVAELTEMAEARRAGEADRPTRSCPRCAAQFLSWKVVIRHLIYQHPDYVTDVLLASAATSCKQQHQRSASQQKQYENVAAPAAAQTTDPDPRREVSCSFCKQRFLSRHQKLLMMHIEQRHLKDLERTLCAALSSEGAATKDPSEEIAIAMSSHVMAQAKDAEERRQRRGNPNDPVDYADGVCRLPTRPAGPEASFEAGFEAAVGAAFDLDANDLRSARLGSPTNHHYYDIVEDDKTGVEAAAAAAAANKKRERSSEEEAEGAASRHKNSAAKKFVKKRLKRIEPSKNAERRRSVELQDLLRSAVKDKAPKPHVGRSNSDKENNNIAPLVRPPSYHKHRRKSCGGGGESGERAAEGIPWTPYVFRATRSFRRPKAGLIVDGDGDCGLTSKTYRGVPQPEPEEASPGSLEAGDEAGTQCETPQKNQQRLFKCNLCEVAFLENAFLLTHLKNRHRTSSVMAVTMRPQYSCGACPARFFKNSFLVRHCEKHFVQSVACEEADLRRLR